MSPNNRRVLLATAAVALLAVPRAHATLARAVSFDEKVDSAAAIVLGKVVRTESRWDAQHRWILTYSTFAVEKSMKGAAAGELTVALPGGAVGDLHQDTIGMPSFEQGEEHVVFVRNSAIGPTVAFAEQGTYDVTANERGERIVQPHQAEAAVVDEQRGLAVAPEQARTVAQFERDVLASMKRTQFQRMEMIKARQAQQEASLLSLLSRYRLLLGLAVVGAALATWQFLRR